jgi:pyruvate/2-oxoglutarate dehydrogenase complex dihydrolipoamide acyltransferase (E2) component
VKTVVTMPKLGDASTDVVIEEWLVQPGATVAVGDVLAMAETSKALVEVPSPAAGTLVEILVQQGSEVDVGTDIAVIES